MHFHRWWHKSDWIETNRKYAIDLPDQHEITRKDVRKRAAESHMFANSKAELANDELMETVYTSRSIDFQFRLFLKLIVNDFSRLFRSLWTEFWWSRWWRFCLWGWEKDESTARESKLTQSIAWHKGCRGKERKRLPFLTIAQVLLRIWLRIVQIFSTWQSTKIANGINNFLGWKLGSSHFKSLNLNRWLVILSIYSGLWNQVYVHYAGLIAWQ